MAFFDFYKKPLLYLSLLPIMVKDKSDRRNDDIASRTFCRIFLNAIDKRFINMSKQDCIKAKGLITEAIGGDRFRVMLENGVSIIGTLSGKIRQKHIRVMPGDNVEIELSPYDMTKGRISYRYIVKN